MNRFLSFFILTGFLFAQDVLTTLSGKKYSGKLLEEQQRHVVFQPEASPNSQRLPITSINKIQLANGSVIEYGKDILTTNTGEFYKGYYLKTTTTEVEFFVKSDMKSRLFKKEIINNVRLSDGFIIDLDLVTVNMSEEELIEYNKTLKIKREKRLCEERKGMKVLVMPIKYDFYGLTEIIEDNYDTLCFNMIENEMGLEYLHEENVDLDNINDFHLREIGKKLGAHLVIYGYAYDYQVPFKYSATTSDAIGIGELWSANDDTWGTMFNLLGKSLVMQGQVDQRDKAITQAGSYINLTYYSLNIDTGEKVFIVKNWTVLKVG